MTQTNSGSFLPPRGSMYVVLVLTLLGANLAERAAAQLIPTYANPLDVLTADPSVILHEGTYYLYGTSLWYGFKVWSSPDLINWTYGGVAYAAPPDGYGKWNFWAPEVIEKDGTFFLHYTAQGADGILRSCVATSESPLGPFVDVAAPLFDTGDGAAWIDGHVFLDDDGKAYFFVSKDVSKNPTGKSEIYVAPLKPSLAELDGPLTYCIGPSQPWEGPTWNEAPYVLKHKGVYYLMYSGNFYASSNYAVGYATSTRPLGPWTKYENNPILSKTSQVSGPGHNCVTTSLDGTEMFICYHTHQQPTAPSGARQLAVDRLTFVPDPKGGSDLLRVPGGGSVLPRPWPSGAPFFSLGKTDDFLSGVIDRSQWLVFNEDPSKVFETGGQLRITTQAGDIFEAAGADAKNIFLQYPPEGDFRIVTDVHFTPLLDYEQAFLIVWQDHNTYLRFSMLWDGRPVFEVLKEVDGAKETKVQTPNTIESPVFLRIDCEEGNTFRCSFSPDGLVWTQVGPDVAMTLREIKVGLGAISPGSGAARSAQFDFFDIAPLTTSGLGWNIWKLY